MLELVLAAVPRRGGSVPRPPNCWSLLLELLDGYCGWTRLPALELLDGCCGTSRCCRWSRWSCWTAGLLVLEQ